jgi:hypothetical protein
MRNTSVLIVQIRRLHDLQDLVRGKLLEKIGERRHARVVLRIGAERSRN